MSFPRYQYSVFLKNARDEQLVIRADKFEDLIEAKKNIDKIVEKHEKAQPKPQSIGGSSLNPVAQPKEHSVHGSVVPVSIACSKCGGATTRKEGVNKAGRPYKGNYCNDKANCNNVDWF